MPLASVPVEGAGVQLRVPVAPVRQQPLPATPLTSGLLSEMAPLGQITALQVLPPAPALHAYHAQTFTVPAPVQVSLMVGVLVLALSVTV